MEKICYHQAYFSKTLNQYLANSNLNEQECNRLKELLGDKSDVENAFLSLDSEYKLNSFAKLKLNYIKSIEYKPDPRKNETYQYVSIIETLQNLLSHYDIFAHDMNSHKSNDGILRDFCDGEVFERNTLFSNDPTALQIMLFFDEFTAVNPFGHQVKNYKIGWFYMLLGNLPPKFRSQLYGIQLVALCLSSSIKCSGFQNVLEPFINDLHILEREGITVCKSDGMYTFFGIVSVVEADNLGAHSIGGFMESFNTHRNCRFCFITKEDMKRKYDYDNFNFRTVETYTEQVSLVENDRSLANVYGLKTRCPLSDLDHFHCINGLPSDIAHDLFEGVMSYVMTNVIKYFVSEGFFSVQDLNNSISSFKFAEMDKSNKPSKVTDVLSKLKISQSAAQMWCFIRFLPLLVGDKIPRNDRIWECILLLRDMLFYVCAPALAREHILAMSNIIQEFNESYMNCFPEEGLKPKFHYTLHYSKLTLLFGPLVHLQTLRFEGKHNYFKELVFRTKNRKTFASL